MNFSGAAAVLLSVAAFALSWSKLRVASVGVRLAILLGFAVLAIPAVWFAAYYFHFLPEQAWLYTLRSWRGSEFLVVFLGGALGAGAFFLPRLLVGIPLLGLLLFGSIPYLKPILDPLRDETFAEHWKGDVCLQSTTSTCGAACVATVLKHEGVSASERGVARAAFSSGSGTEAWYLARGTCASGASLRALSSATLSRRKPACPPSLACVSADRGTSSLS